MDFKNSKIFQIRLTLAHLVNCLVKRSDFGLIAVALKCAATVYIFFYQVFFIKRKNPTQKVFFTVYFFTPKVNHSGVFSWVMSEISYIFVGFMPI